MKCKVVAVDKPTIIHPAEVHKMSVDFINFSSREVSFPKEYFTPASYCYEVENGKVVGNRSCVVGDELYIDTPIEWGKKELLDYIVRVKKTHNREFSFFEGYEPESGEADLAIPRPYIHIEEDVFFCGSVEYWNFGFFLCVLMQKVFLACSIDQSRKILVPVCNSWQVKLLRTFFPNANFIFFDPSQIVSFRRMTVIGWPGFGFHMHSGYVKYLGDMVASFKFDGAVDPYNLWFARQDGLYGKRFEIIKKLSSDLLKNGFVPVYPELLNPERIAKMVNGSRSIVLDSGSALFNLIFSQEKNSATLFESRSDFLLNHSRFMNSCEMNSKVIFVDELSDIQSISKKIFNSKN